MPFTFVVGSSSVLRVTSADTERLRCGEFEDLAKPGSKSEKLSEAFQSRGGGKLDQKSIQCILETILLGVSRVCRQGCEKDVRDECKELADDVGPSTFDEFGEWYNERGFGRAPWLELLDADKWPRTIAFEIESRDDSRPHSPPVLLRAEFSSLALSRVRAVAVGSGLFEAPCLRFSDNALDYRKFYEEMNRDQKVFDRERKVVFDLLFALFRRKQGDARADELAAGLSILCSGSKSEKLATTWDIVNSSTDSSNKSVQRQGTLSRHALKRYLRSFLLVLLALARDDLSLKEDHHQSRRDQLFDDADAAAATVAAEVFSSINDTASPPPPKEEQRNAISFDDFAEWYTRGGFQSASWLELLDLNKWVL